MLFSSHEFLDNFTRKKKNRGKRKFQLKKKMKNKNKNNFTQNMIMS